MQDERHSLGGGERLEQHEERQADRVAEEGLVLGIHPVGAIDDRLGYTAGWVLFGRALRARSMFRQTRATTVVNHAPRLSISLSSVRLIRIQASWTASSASEGEPSIR